MQYVRVCQRQLSYLYSMSSFLVALDVAYLCKKFYNFIFSYSWGMCMALKLDVT